MENELWRLDTASLKQLYEAKQKELTSELLEGASWQDVQPQRWELTALSIVLYRRTASSNPAEYNTRNDTSTK